MSAGVTQDDETASMTAKRLIKICRKKGLYETPEYNDSLFLNYEGFNAIKNLEPYINIKSLFLEGNVIANIENISHLKHLRGLYLQKNIITAIGKELNNLTELTSLDLGNNEISSIKEGELSNLKNLETLNLENNRLSAIEDVEEIIHNKSLITLNLNGNKFDTKGEGMKLLSLLSKLPNLKTLYLKGNKFLNNMDFYRKYAISMIRTLTFLDDRPVFENERRLNDAWIRGGREAEQEEKRKIEQEKIDKRNETRRIRRERYEARRAAMMARIEREEREQREAEEQKEAKEAESRDVAIADDVSEEGKSREQDIVLQVVQESKLQDLRQSDGNDEQDDNEEKEDEIDLPGMVNRNLNLDLD